MRKKVKDKQKHLGMEKKPHELRQKNIYSPGLISLTAYNSVTKNFFGEKKKVVSKLSKLVTLSIKPRLI